MASKIVTLSSADRSQIVDVLSRAFYEYPVFRYVLKNTGGEYERLLKLLIGFFVDARTMRDWPVIGIKDADGLAAALLLSDPVFKPRPEPLTAVYKEVASEIGSEALARLEEFESASAQYEPESQTYFVGMIGVDPSRQRSGYGRRLMRHVETLSLDRPESSGITLTTEVPENIAFYESLGYRLLGETEVGDITTWFFHLKH